MLTTNSIINAGGGDILRTVAGIGAVEAPIGACRGSWTDRLKENWVPATNLLSEKEEELSQMC